MGSEERLSTILVSIFPDAGEAVAAEAKNRTAAITGYIMSFMKFFF